MSNNIVYTLDNGSWCPHPIVTSFAEVIMGSQVSVATSALSAMGTMATVPPPYIQSLSGLQAYWPMNDESDQLDLVNGNVATLSAADIGRQLTSPDRWDFGETIANLTVTPTEVGSGSVTGEFVFAAQITTSSSPYPITNAGHSAPITVSGVDHIEVDLTGLYIPSPKNINWTIQDVTSGNWKTGASSSTLPYSHSAAELAPPYPYATEAAIPDNYQAPAFQRRSIGHLAVSGNPFGFGGTDSFSGIVKIDCLNYEEGLADNWIVSCFNTAKTEGWGIELRREGDMWISFVRRNAAGSDSLALGLSGFEGSPGTTWASIDDMIAFTYDGTTMRLSKNADWVGDVSRTSSRSIDDSASAFRIGDGYIGVTQPVVIGDAVWSEAEITDVQDGLSG